MWSFCYQSVLRKDFTLRTIDVPNAVLVLAYVRSFSLTLQLNLQHDVAPTMIKLEPSLSWTQSQFTLPLNE